jgi:hypothetical protein
VEEWPAGAGDELGAAGDLGGGDLGAGELGPGDGFDTGGAFGTGLQRRPPGALSPAERAIRRRNRRLMGFVLLPSIVIGAIALVAALAASSTGPSVHPLDVPAGYQAISGDGYFAYSVPSSWSQSSAYTDDVGDLDYQGATGWAAEHLDARANPPTAGETPPNTFAAFGEPKPTPYQIGAATPTRVDGATVAFRYTVTRPGGFEATAVDAWQGSSGAEIWLLIDADPSTTSAILASLRD